MRESANVTLPSAPDLRRFQGWILFRLRWAAIAALLLITFIMPTSSYVAVPKNRPKDTKRAVPDGSTAGRFRVASRLWDKKSRLYGMC